MSDERREPISTDPIARHEISNQEGGRGSGHEDGAETAEPAPGVSSKHEGRIFLAALVPSEGMAPTVVDSTAQTGRGTDYRCRGSSEALMTMGAVRVW
ncbi:uncharacterized protein DNG_07658 [Cephalotrichum gorgonifer]|uniref:Uncharacterized protein n=1 Tax=Cephalotrichum gorgonifer TaxID=2041049 RepID=A0AAE8N4L2_9PEZI|nr:uncharacterized protein DNG_07658 [Cephalotrichum gorgonifer]